MTRSTPAPDSSRIIAKLFTTVPRSGWLLIVVAAMYMAAWSLAVPVFEAPDEPAHWQVARYVFDHQQLPLYDATMVEANQPPMYYLLIALFARPSDEPTRAAWIDGDDTMRQTFPPRWYLNTSHDLSRYRPIRIVRLVTVLMGAVALVFVYLSAVEATGSHPVGLLAVGLVGFLPQFSFRSGTISNDTLLVTFSALATWLMIRIVQRGFSWQWGASAAAAFGFAYLTKVNAICLGPPLALAILLDRVPLVERLRHLAVFAVTALVVAPWSLRNLYLYGDAFASRAMTTAVVGLIHTKPITAPWLWTYFPYAVSRSFVGVFGWMNVWMPQWIYSAYWCLGTLAAIGLLTMLVRTRGRMPVEAVLLTIVILSVAVVVHINLSFDQPQGRYLFPALPAVGLLIATGLASLPIGVIRPRLGMLIVVLMVLLNSYVFAKVVLPAYYPPPSLTESRAVVGVPRPRPYGLTPVDGSGELFRITADDPQLTSSVAIDARDLGVLQFEVEGSAADPVVIGSVYFSRSDSPATEQQRVDFRWKADGTRRLINVPLGGHPAWRGHITVVRIDPINERVRQNRGAVVRVSRITLRGSW